MTSEANDTVKSLREAADELDKAWNDCKRAHALGTTAEIVGGIFSISGAVATFFPTGIYRPLLLLFSGMGFGGGGALVNLVASYVGASINSKKNKKAVKDGETLDCINDVNDTVQLWLDRKEKARVLYSFYLAVHTMELSNPAIKLILKVLLHSLGIPANIVQAACDGALGAGQAGAQGAGAVAESVAKAGTKTESKISGGLIIVLSLAFLLADAADLTFTIRDLAENKGSKAAKFLIQKADELANKC